MNNYIDPTADLARAKRALNASLRALIGPVVVYSDVSARGEPYINFTNIQTDRIELTVEADGARWVVINHRTPHACTLPDGSLNTLTILATGATPAEAMHRAAMALEAEEQEDT